MKYLLHGGFWLTLRKLLTIATSLALSIAFANLISPTLYGKYKFVLSMVAIAGAFSITGFGPVISRAVANGYEGTLASMFRLKLKWSTLPSAIILGISVYYFINSDLILSSAFFVCFFLYSLSTTPAIYSFFLVGKKEFKSLSIYEAVSQLLLLVIMILVLVQGHTNLALIVGSFYGIKVIHNLFFYIRTSRKFVHNNNVDPIAKKYSLHLSFMNVIGRIAAEVDKILIFYYLGAAQLAVYAFALGIPGHIKSMNQVIYDLAFPKLSIYSVSKRKKIILHKIMIYTIISSFIVGLYWFISPYLYKFLFPQYLNSIFYSQLFSLTLILAAPMLFFNAIINAKAWYKDLYISKISTSVVKIVLLLLLVPKLGVLGAVLALLGALASQFVILSVLFALIREDQ